jgi:hypothetical protein
MQEELLLFDKVKDSQVYVYHLQKWLCSGAHLRMWWKLVSGKCFFLYQFIEEDEKLKQGLNRKKRLKERGSEEFSSPRLTLMVRELTDFGVLDFPLHNENKIMTNYDDYFAIKTEDGSSNSFMVRCGHHSDERYVEIINCLLANTKCLK